MHSDCWRCDGGGEWQPESGVAMVTVKHNVRTICCWVQMTRCAVFIMFGRRDIQSAQ